MGKPFRFSAGISKVAPGGPEYPLGGSEDAVRPDGLFIPGNRLQSGADRRCE